MNKNEYGEIINGINSYKKIAERLLYSGNCIIGWTDDEYDHRDILFAYKPYYLGGGLQRGLKSSYLYISIMGLSCMGFRFNANYDNRKSDEYIKEKLSLNNNHCDDKTCELINGVIAEMDLIIKGVEIK